MDYLLTVNEASKRYHVKKALLEAELMKCDNNEGSVFNKYDYRKIGELYLINKYALGRLFTKKMTKTRVLELFGELHAHTINRCKDRKLNMHNTLLDINGMMQLPALVEYDFVNAIKDLSQFIGEYSLGSDLLVRINNIISYINEFDLNNFRLGAIFVSGDRYEWSAMELAYRKSFFCSLRD